jgi:hypothetical protein
MARYIFHLGYPKTGTTYLQRKLFTQLAGTYAVITPEFENLGVTIQKLKSQIQSNTLPADLRGKIGDRPLLFSIEGLLFDPIQQFAQPETRRARFDTALQGLRRLAADAPETEIAIVLYLRAQAELVHSLYAESKTYHFDPVPGLDTLDGFARAVMTPAQGPTDAGWYFDFANTLREIRAVFPHAALHLRFYENLSEAPEAEVAFWSELTGQPLQHVQGRDNARARADGAKTADPNSLHVHIVRLKKRFLPGLKLPNRLKFIVRDLLRKIGRGDSMAIVMAPETAAAISACFAPANAALADLGHPVPPELAPLYLATAEDRT